ncbi:hypothetical protein N9X60_03930 [Paracoccaceae bacterium]|nr:hypothetical protein [Paracoccaceae bacterium]
MDFNPEEDCLVFQLYGLSVIKALSLSHKETDLILKYDVGSLILAGQATAELIEDRFLFG